jgi:hypothetical protein
MLVVVASGATWIVIALLTAPPSACTVIVWVPISASAGIVTVVEKAPLTSAVVVPIV